MKVGEAPDLRLGVSVGSAEQIHFAQPELPLSESDVRFWGESNFLSYFLAGGSVQKRQSWWKAGAYINWEMVGKSGFYLG